VSWGDADIISSGRDPDRVPRLPRQWQLPRRWRPPRRWHMVAAAAALVAGAGTAAGLLLTACPPGRAAGGSRGSRPAEALLSGTAAGPDGAPGTVLLLTGDGPLRVLTAAGRAPVSLRWPGTVPGATSPLGQAPVVENLLPVSGGFVTLLTTPRASCCRPPVGAVFFLPVTARGVGAPRQIAQADHLAVAPGGQGIWVQRTGRPGETWLIDTSGRRLSPVLRLGSRVLLAATARGLLTGRGQGGGASLVSPVTGAAESLRIPPGALLAAVGPSELAWQAHRCARLACPLHVTNLLTGTDTVIPLPKGTQTNGQPGAFDQAGRRLAMTLDTIGGRHRPAATHVYVIGVASRQVSMLPGGPLPLTQAANLLGAIVGDFTGFNSVSWPAGPDLWIVADGPPGFQAAYWPGSGPLRLLRPQRGQVFGFAVSGPQHVH